MNNIPNDIPKYRKKSQAKPPAKAKHKHVYEACLIETYRFWWSKPHERDNVRVLHFSSYCPICGKVGDMDHDRWYMRVVKYHENGSSYLESVHTEEAERELNPTTRTIQLFKADTPFVKFVEIEKEK